jgi:hypothetical protein
LPFDVSVLKLSIPSSTGHRRRVCPIRCFTDPTTIVCHYFYCFENHLNDQILWDNITIWSFASLDVPVFFSMDCWRFLYDMYKPEDFTLVAVTSSALTYIYIPDPLMLNSLGLEVANVIV